MQLNTLYPVPSTAPMFSYMGSDRLVVITQTQARKVLSTSLSNMGLNPKDYGFHTFRRSSASLASSLNIPIQFIKAQIKGLGRVMPYGTILTKLVTPPSSLPLWPNSCQLPPNDIGLGLI